MQRLSLVFLLSSLSSNVFAQACHFSPLKGQAEGNESCVENISAPSEFFQQICINGGDETMAMEKVTACSKVDVTGVCEIRLSMGEGTFMQYQYSSQYKEMYRKVCENHPMGEGRWIVDKETHRL